MQNDSGFLTEHQSLINYIQKSQTVGLIKNDGTIDTTQYLSSLPSHNHDDRYYTESEVDTALNGKQATLISGTNIKTINNTSLLGSGNINIQGGGTVTVDDSLSTASTNPVQNKVINRAIGEIKSDLGNLSFVSEYAVRNWLSEDSVKDYLNAEFRKENQTLKKAAITEIINTVIFFAVIIVLIILIK